MPHRPPQNTSQHVAAAFVAGIHPVGKEEGDGPGMICEHPVRGSLIGAPVIGAADQLTNAIDQRQEHVGVKIVVLALHDGGDSLQPRTRVHRRLRQRSERAIGRAVVLHEDEIPDLQESPFFCQPLEFSLRNYFSVLAARLPRVPGSRST